MKRIDGRWGKDEFVKKKWIQPTKYFYFAMLSFISLKKIREMGKEMQCIGTVFANTEFLMKKRRNLAFLLVLNVPHWSTFLRLC